MQTAEPDHRFGSLLGGSDEVREDLLALQESIVQVDGGTGRLLAEGREAQEPIHGCGSSSSCLLVISVKSEQILRQKVSNQREK